MRFARNPIASILPPLLVGLQSLVLLSCEPASTQSPLSPESAAFDRKHNKNDRVRSIVVSLPDSSIEVGERIQTTVVALDARGGPVSDPKLHWQLSPSEVGSVSSSGVVTGLALGKAKVTVSSQGTNREVWVEVVAADDEPDGDGEGDTSGDAADDADGDADGDAAADTTPAPPDASPPPPPADTVITPAAPAPSGPMGPTSGPATVAELPRASVATDYPHGGRQVRVPAGSNLQAAINAAQPGDELLLPAGSRWVGNFVLPDKGSSSSWIVIRTDLSDAALGSAGTRMTPSRASSLGLAKIFTPSNQAAIATVNRAHHWRVTGVEISTTGGQDVYSLVEFGAWNSSQRDLASTAHSLVLDRSYVHGLSSLNVRRCVFLNSANSAVVDSWLGECHSNEGDSQAIGGVNGPGPFLIQNNMLEGGHMAFMFGGGDPLIPGLVPSDITIRGNHLYRPVAWKGVWQTKTIAETKNARRLLIEGNVIENVWTDAQAGFALLFKSSNQDGACTWCTTSDVTVRYNRIRNVAAVFNIAAKPELNPAVPAARFMIHDNVTDNVDVGQFTGSGINLQVIGNVADVVFAHNTTISPSANSITMFDGSPNARFAMHSNVLSHGVYGVFGSGAGIGTGALSVYMPGSLFANNVLIGGTCSNYPAGTSCPATISLLGFVNALGGDYRLSASSVYRVVGYDGREVGADVARVASSTMGAVVAP